MGPGSARRPPAGRSLVAVAGGIAVLTLLARLAGFGRTAVLAGVAGRTCVADAYLTANQLPNVVFEVVAGGALAATVVPLVGRALLVSPVGLPAVGPRAAGAGPPAGPDRDGRRGSPARPGHPDPDAVRTLSALLGWVLLLLVPAAVVCAAAAPVIARALTGAGCAGEAALVARLLLFFAPQIPLYGLAVLAAGLLQARHRFTAAAAAPLASSVVVVAGYLLFAAAQPAAGVPAPAAVSSPALLALAGGTTAGVGALALTVLIAAGRLPEARLLRPTLRFPPGVGRLAGRLAGAGLAAVVAAQGAALLVTLVANHRGAPGTLAVYTYAAAVYLLPAAILTTPVTTSVLPRVVAADPEPGRRLAAGSLGVVLLLGFIGGAVLFAAAPEIGRIFDAGPGATAGGRGAAPATVGSTLSWLAPGVPGLAVSTHLARLTTALRQPGMAAALGTTGWLLAAAGTLLAGWHVDAPRLAEGLAAATAAGMAVGGLVAVAGWLRVAGRDGLHGCLVPVALGIPAALAGALAGRLAGTGILGGAAGSLETAGGTPLRDVAAGLLAAVAAVAAVAVVLLGAARLTGLRLPWPPSAAR